MTEKVALNSWPYKTLPGEKIANVSPSPDHHKQLAHDVTRVPLDGEPPDRLHGQRHVGGDGVSQGQVKHQVVHIGAAPHLLIIRHLTPFCEFLPLPL